MMCPEPRFYLIFKRSIPYAQLLRSAGSRPKQRPLRTWRKVAKEIA
jgi:hypothetical protein